MGSLIRRPSHVRRRDIGHSPTGGSMPVLTQPLAAIQLTPKADSDVIGYIKQGESFSITFAPSHQRYIEVLNIENIRGFVLGDLLYRLEDAHTVITPSIGVVAEAEEAIRLVETKVDSLPAPTSRPPQAASPVKGRHRPWRPFWTAALITTAEWGVITIAISKIIFFFMATVAVEKYGQQPEAAFRAFHAMDYIPGLFTAGLLTGFFSVKPWKASKPISWRLAYSAFGFTVTSIIAWLVPYLFYNQSLNGSPGYLSIFAILLAQFEDPQQQRLSLIGWIRGKS